MFARLMVSAHSGQVLGTDLVFAERPVQDYANSCIEVAQYQMSIPDGDLELAVSYMETVAVSNAEEVARASELLKVAKIALAQARAKSKETDMAVEIGDTAPLSVESKGNKNL